MKKEKPKEKPKDKRETYAAKMKTLGYIRIHPYVHKDDKDAVQEFIADLRDQRND